MTAVYLSLGSNLNDREKNLILAISYLTKNSKIKNLKQTNFLETKPVGFISQPDFFNCSIFCDTDMGICELMYFIQSIENEMGRERIVKWGPRNIDIDIILYGECIVNIGNPHIVVPHPEMLNRKFVIKQLLELNAEITYPLSGKKISEIDASHF